MALSMVFVLVLLVVSVVLNMVLFVMLVVLLLVLMVLLVVLMVLYVLLMLFLIGWLLLVGRLLLVDWLLVSLVGLARRGNLVLGLLELSLKVMVCVNEILVCLGQALNLEAKLGSSLLGLLELLRELLDTLVQSFDLVVIGFASSNLGRDGVVDRLLRSLREGSFLGR